MGTVVQGLALQCHTLSLCLPCLHQLLQLLCLQLSSLLNVPVIHVGDWSRMEFLAPGFTLIWAGAGIWEVSGWKRSFSLSLLPSVSSLPFFQTSK